MTDKFADLRAALAAGPTPGPWEIEDGRTDTVENAQGYPVCKVPHHPDERYGHGVRATYIAACDPDTIRALLEERDELARERDELKREAVILREAILAVEDLIQHSHGVAGLHQNGDIAPWSELLAGGRFEGWLCAFSAAVDRR